MSSTQRVIMVALHAGIAAAACPAGERQMSWASLSPAARVLIHRAGVALADPGVTLDRLRALAAELSLACRDATHWSVSSRCGEAWGRVVDRIRILEEDERIAMGIFK